MWEILSTLRQEPYLIFVILSQRIFLPNFSSHWMFHFCSKKYISPTKDENSPHGEIFLHRHCFVPGPHFYFDSFLQPPPIQPFSQKWSNPSRGDPTDRIPIPPPQMAMFQQRKELPEICGWQNKSIFIMTASVSEGRNKQSQAGLKGTGQVPQPTLWS